MLKVTLDPIGTFDWSRTQEFNTKMSSANLKNVTHNSSTCWFNITISVFNVEDRCDQLFNSSSTTIQSIYNGLALHLKFFDFMAIDPVKPFDHFAK